MQSMKKYGLVLSAGVVLLGSIAGWSQKLGTIDFQTSANAAAQPHFIEGVKDLHSFAFDEAAAAFREAEKADPNFALAYWGEAMSFNHPLWAQQDLPAARAVLERLAPTAEGRLAKGGSEKERAYLAAQQKLFYGSDDKLARDIAYADAVAEMHKAWPNDDEISIFYALSLLGTVRPGDVGFRRQALAASLALPIFHRNPDHPGAAHFIIHAFDDPDHAILALPAALKYAQIAPDAPHALHMPSHIFVQLGMWDRVRSSNTAAYASAERVVQKYHTKEGGEDFHELSWLQFGNLMLGRFDEAAQDLGYAHDALVRNPESPQVQNGYLTMRARQILESGDWREIPIVLDGIKPNAQWLFIAGYVAAHNRNYDLAGQASERLKALFADTSTNPTPYAGKPLTIFREELDAEVAFQKGDTEQALKLAKDAATLELTLKAPSGPPEPIKPAAEYYAELLARAGKKDEAVQEFSVQLLRTPNRTPSVLGLKILGRAPSQSVVPVHSANESHEEGHTHCH